MASITALIPDPRRPGRYALSVDDRVVATVSVAAIERLGLRVGRAYDDIAAAVEGEAAALATYDRALRMLATRGRSAQELRRMLVRKGEPTTHVDAAIARLVEQGFLDDASFARQFARSKLEGAGLSRRRLSAELRRKGVDRQVADVAIEESIAEDGIDEEAIMDRIAHSKLRTLGSLDRETRRRRLFGHLARRGYDPEAIRRAIERALDHAAREDDRGEDDRGEDDRGEDEPESA